MNKSRTNSGSVPDHGEEEDVHEDGVREGRREVRAGDRSRRTRDEQELQTPLYRCVRSKPMEAMIQFKSNPFD